MVSEFFIASLEVKEIMAMLSKFREQIISNLKFYTQSNTNHAKSK